MGVNAGTSGGVMVCGTSSDAGKSFVVAGLCRLLARNGVRVAPFKAQNMANNAAVTVDGGEIGHAQWVQAVAAGIEPTTSLNPVLLKPTSERSSQVVLRGRARGEFSARDYHQLKPELLPEVLGALAELRDEYDVVICEGAGSPAEINLLDRDLVNLGLADAAGLPALVVGDIDRGGVFASLYGTVALLPDDLRARVAGFVVNRFRGDPELLGTACKELEVRCGVPTVGVVPYLSGMDLDAEDSLGVLALATSAIGDVARAKTESVDVAAVRWPYLANAGDLDPLRCEPDVRLRWVQSVAELGQPDLVVLPGSKSTRADLDWFRKTGLAGAIECSDAPVVAVCAGLQMVGRTIHDPEGVEGPAGTCDGLGWLGVETSFASDKVLDRPEGRSIDGHRVHGYRIHNGRVRSIDGAEPWLIGDDGAVIGWCNGAPEQRGAGSPVYGTSLHALFEADPFRSAVLKSVAQRAGKSWTPSGVDFGGLRQGRLDGIADALESSLDLSRLAEVIEMGKS